MCTDEIAESHFLKTELTNNLKSTNSIQRYIFKAKCSLIHFSLCDDDERILLYYMTTVMLSSKNRYCSVKIVKTNSLIYWQLDIKLQVKVN